MQLNINRKLSARLHKCSVSCRLIMERTIRTLKEMREKAERSFIENSIIVHRASLDSPIPDTKSDLEMIIELNQAISILQNATMAKSVVNGS
jgi:hypothetical protein